MSRPGDTSLGGPQKDFPKTAWGLVSQARDPATQVREAGLEELCRNYWKPVYSHFRIAWSKSNEDAKDLAQAFFVWLLEGEALRRYSPARAGFRTYLKSLLRHFVQNHDQALHRLKRGGGVRILDLEKEAEALSDPKSRDPERVFDEEWRRAILSRALAEVRGRHEGSIPFRVYEAYELAPPEARPTYPALAARLGIKESDVRNHLSSVRDEIRAEIRAELSRTTLGGQDLEDEWNAFLSP